MTQEELQKIEQLESKNEKLKKEYDDLSKKLNEAEDSTKYWYNKYTECQHRNGNILNAITSILELSNN